MDVLNSPGCIAKSRISLEKRSKIRPVTACWSNWWLPARSGSWPPHPPSSGPITPRIEDLSIAKKNNNLLFVFKLSKAFPNPSQSLTTHTKPAGGGARPTSWWPPLIFFRRLKSDRALWNFERLCYRRHLFIFFLFSFASSLLSCNFVLFFLCVCVCFVKAGAVLLAAQFWRKPQRWSGTRPVKPGAGISGVATPFKRFTAASQQMRRIGSASSEGPNFW